jgi:hypothetical protein
VKAIPILQQKIISLSKKRTEAGNLVDPLRDNKRPALDKGTATNFRLVSFVSPVHVVCVSLTNNFFRRFYCTHRRHSRGRQYLTEQVAFSFVQSAASFQHQLCRISFLLLICCSYLLASNLCDVTLNCGLVFLRLRQVMTMAGMLCRVMYIR